MTSTGQAAPGLSDVQLQEIIGLRGLQVAAETRAYLSGLGVDLFGEQQTKTRTALEYLAGQLKA